MKVIVHYAEIGIKGKNRGFFESKLMRNIGVDSSYRDNTRIIFDANSSDKLKIIENLSKIFGIKYFCFAEESSVDLDSVLGKAKEVISRMGIKSIAFKTKRSDKKFPLTSIELNAEFGRISNELGMKVNYGNPERVLYTEITDKKAYFYTEKIPGLGGLPVGVSGKVLVLFSGGIDSCVAAWLMMKRGCDVDFLHFHTFKENQEVLDTKISGLVKILKGYGGACKLFLVPYHNYQLAVVGKVPERFDVVVFKNFMLRVCADLARKKGYKALIVGDSVGQVASQTLDNIASSRFGVKVPILSPLICYDKEEIIDLAKKIGTFELSIEKYKDCCSIIARNPSTSVKIGMVERVLERIEIDKLVDESLGNLESFS
tara:strand:- start:2019 stop:3134 length:1116 start_codon:yes stop_codon:yes gene_type:complete